MNFILKINENMLSKIIAVVNNYVITALFQGFSELMLIGGPCDLANKKDSSKYHVYCDEGKPEENWKDTLYFNSRNCGIPLIFPINFSDFYK